MDDQLLLHLYHRLFDPGKLRRAAGCVYSDSLIALIYFLGVLRGRSPRWACDRRNWPLWMRRLDAPSYSQFLRRLATRSVRLLVVQVNVELRDQLPRSTTEKFCDGKPLAVGGCSKDPDARRGRLPSARRGERCWGRGYRLHLIVDAACGAIDAFTITGLDAGEPTVMRRLVASGAADLRGVLLRGDSGYDSNRLYADVAAAGGRLVASRKRPGSGLGHHRHHPDRLRAIAELEQADDDGRQGQPALTEHKRHRIRVEQTLAHLTNLPGGLAPLPNFVRRRHRVAMWVLAKVTLYHLYLVLRQPKLKAA